MTRAQFIAAIKREARLENSTDLDTMIGDMLNEELTTVCQRKEYFELCVQDAPITTINNTAIYTLPTDFQRIKGLRYGVTATPTRWYELVPPPDYCTRPTENGYPQFYTLVGDSVVLHPYSRVLAGDQLLITYYKDPLTDFSADDDTFPVPKIQPMIKSRVLSRLARYHAKDTEVAQTQQSGQEQYIATVASTKA